jgi:hypothetical protein
MIYTLSTPNDLICKNKFSQNPNRVSTYYWFGRKKAPMKGLGGVG